MSRGKRTRFNGRAKRNPGGGDRSGLRVTSQAGRPTLIEHTVPLRVLDAIADVIDAIDGIQASADAHVARLDSLRASFKNDPCLRQKREALAHDAAHVAARICASLRAIERRGGPEDRMVSDLRALCSLARDASEVL